MAGDEQLDLVREELAELVDLLLARSHAQQPFGVYACRYEDSESMLGRLVEQRVFLEAFGNTPADLAAEYGAYDASSVFVVVVDHLRRVPAGMMRVIVPSEAGFKSLHDMQRGWGNAGNHAVAAIAESDWDLDCTWDLATLAVDPDYRGQAALGLVTQSLVQWLTTVGTPWGVQQYLTILDVPVFRMLQWRLGRPFAEFPGIEPRPYLGSASSVPVWGDRDDWDARLVANDPRLHELLFRGRGLEHAVWTEDVDVSIDCARRTTAGAPRSGTPVRPT